MPLSHIRRGDVVFTADMGSTVMHRVISTAQVFGSSPGGRDAVHAAIATGNGFEVIESVGSGLKKRPLSPGNYRLFCFRGTRHHDIRNLAVLVAEDFYTRGLSPTFGDYNKFKATLSPFRSSKNGHQAPNIHTQQFGHGAKAKKSFFCSNLIFRCYAAAGEALEGPGQPAILPIPDSHAQISPRDLEGLLIRSHDWHARGGGQAMSHP